MNDEKTHVLDERRHVKLLWGAFLGVLALTVVAELFVPLHPHFEIESWFAFAAWYGFGTCVLMIVAARALALLLKRRDTYYADREQRHD
jgi:hypothetical protein